MLVMIVAVNKHRTIGFQGQMPWRNKEDLQHFRSTTMGHTVVMGRKTFEGLPKTLDGRNIRVVTRSKSYPNSIQDLNSFCLKHENTDTIIFIAGGGEIYKQCMPYARKVYMSIIHDDDCVGDTFFPELDREFKETQTQEYKTFTLKVFEREEQVQ